MAIIRNTLIVAFRLAGWNNLKQARRHFSRVSSGRRPYSEQDKTVENQHGRTLDRPGRVMTASHWDVLGGVASGYGVQQ